jgi:chromosome segregation ATPase
MSTHRDSNGEGRDRLLSKCKNVIEDLQNELMLIKDENGAFRQQISEFKNEFEIMSNYIENSKNYIEEKNQELGGLQADYESLEQEFLRKTEELEGFEGRVGVLNDTKLELEGQL